MNVKIKRVNYESKFIIIEDLKLKKNFKVSLKNDFSNFYSFKYKNKKYYFIKYFDKFDYIESNLFQLDNSIEIKKASDLIKYLEDLKNNSKYFESFTKYAFENIVKHKLRIEKNYCQYKESWDLPTYFTLVFIMNKGLEEFLTQKFWNRLFSILYFAVKKLKIRGKQPRIGFLYDNKFIGYGLIQ